MPCVALDGGAGNRTILKLNASTHDCRYVSTHASNATIAHQRAHTSREPAEGARFNPVKHCSGSKADPRC